MGKNINDRQLENVIMDALASGTDVEINDGSLLESVFSESGDYDGNGSGRPHFAAYDPARRFPLLSFIYRNLCTLILLAVWALYWLVSKTSSLLTGRKTDYRYSVKLNGIILFSCMVLTFVVVASMMVFFIKDIMFRSPEMSINSRGAIVLQQPCKQEYYVYLMNSSDTCSDTGISLSTGDKVEVAYSGSFYSDICDMVISSSTNNMTQYTRSPSRVLAKTYSRPTKSQADSIKLRIRKSLLKDTASYNFELRLSQKADGNATDRKDHYGSLLWAVCGEAQGTADDSSVNWHELSFSRKEGLREKYTACNPSFKADRNGILYFCVNDGYECREDGKIRKPQWSDNLGELLLTVKVTRRVPTIGEEIRHAGSSPVSFFFRRPFSWMTVCYRWLETNVHPAGVIVFFLALSAIFAADHWTGRLQMRLRKKRRDS